MSLGAHSGCPKRGVLQPGRCSNPASVVLQYEGKPINANQKEAVQFLGKTAGKLLITNWVDVAQTQLQGSVQVCAQCQEMIQRHSRTMSPLDSLKFTMHSLDTAGRTANMWGNAASSALGLAAMAGVPYAKEGALWSAKAANAASSVTPSLVASKAVTDQLGLKGPLQGVAQGLLAGKLADFAKGNSVIPEGAGQFASQMLQKLPGTGAGAGQFISQMLQKLPGAGAAAAPAPAASLFQG
jgi:hypothetical protein